MNISVNFDTDIDIGNSSNVFAVDIISKGRTTIVGLTAKNIAIKGGGLLRVTAQAATI